MQNQPPQEGRDPIGDGARLHAWTAPIVDGMIDTIEGIEQHQQQIIQHQQSQIDLLSALLVLLAALFAWLFSARIFPTSTQLVGDTNV